jgi:hypothetical protein
MSIFQYFPAGGPSDSTFWQEIAAFRRLMCASNFKIITSCHKYNKYCVERLSNHTNQMVIHLLKKLPADCETRKLTMVFRRASN